MKSKAKQNQSSLNFICLQSRSGPLIVPYRLERSRRLKRMHMQIDSAHYVVLKMPMRHPESRGLQFLQENGEWICRTLAAQPRVPRLRQYLMRHPRLSLGGRWYKLEMTYQRGNCSYLVEDRRAVVRLTLNPRESTEEQMVFLLRSIARDFLPERLQLLSRRVGVRVHGVTVRDQKCRWGSCSETGAISLNWRLILLAPRLQDHVLLHELAHLRHFDHSRAFHAFLQSLDPRARYHARQLDCEASRIINLGRGLT